MLAEAGVKVLQMDMESGYLRLYCPELLFAWQTLLQQED